MTNYKGEEILLMKEELREFSNFEKILDDNGFWEYRNELLEIHTILSISEYVYNKGEAIMWNRKRFFDQPLIGAIHRFNSFRKILRKAQLVAIKILMKKEKLD